jgi:hypothetical protein
VETATSGAFELLNGELRMHPPQELHHLLFSREEKVGWRVVERIAFTNPSEQLARDPMVAVQRQSRSLFHFDLLDTTVVALR